MVWYGMVWYDVRRERRELRICEVDWRLEIGGWRSGAERTERERERRTPYSTFWWNSVVG